MRKSLYILFGLILLFGQTLFSNIINIPDDYPTIQEGLNMANTGDTVLVAAGTYYENIIWPETNDIKLIGSGEDNCIIDGSQNNSVVCFENHVDSTALLSNFTITNGSRFYGGGIHCVGSPHLEELVISGNNANYGGGIFCTKSADPIISEVVISNNTATDYGGGLYCFEGGYPTLIDVTIIENTAEEGAGVCCDRNSNLSLIRTLISDNSAIGGYSSGGGILCGVNSIINLINVTITNNSAEIVGGIYCDSSSIINLTNCIVWNNAGFEIYVTYGSVIVTYSDIQEGWEGEGNIDADPLFADPQNGDFHLTWANFPIPDSTMSPCIDAGDPDPQYNDPDGTRNDMGAYYFDQTVGVDDGTNPFIETGLFQNYPNPFNKITTIRYFLPRYTEVKTQIYNIKGQLVKTLVEENKHAGYHTVELNAKDMSSGIYFYKLSTSDKTIIKKMVLIQ